MSLSKQERNREAVRRYRSKPDKLAAIKNYQSQYRKDNLVYFADYERAFRKANPARRILKAAKQRAAKKNLEFSVSLSDLGELPTLCPVFRTPIDYMRSSWGDDSPSLDRIDNLQGYIPGNIVVVSFKANRLKSNATVEELGALFRFYEGISK